MKSKISLRHLFVVLGLLLACSVSVQAVQFRVLGFARYDLDLRFDQRGEPVALKVFPDSLSRTYDTLGTEPIVLYKMVEEDGKPRKNVACTVTVPPELTHGILILFPSGTPASPSIRVLPNNSGEANSLAPLTYEYFWLDDSLDARPLGMIEFRNMTRVSIAFRIGDQEKNLAPQGKTQTPLIAGAKRLDFKAAVQLAGKWRVFMSSPLPTRGPSRMLVIFREVAENLRTGPDDPGIRMFRFYDAPSPVPATTP
jgi:hypothetical protein